MSERGRRGDDVQRGGSMGMFGVFCYRFCWNYCVWLRGAWTGGDSSCVSVLSFLISVWVVLRCCIGNRSHYLTTIQCSFIMTTPSPLQLSNPPLSPISFPYRDFLFLLSYHSNRITPLINHFFFSSSSSFLRIQNQFTVCIIVARIFLFFLQSSVGEERKDRHGKNNSMDRGRHLCRWFY